MAALRDLVPDLGLVGAGLHAGRDLDPGALVLQPPHPWIGRLPGGLEAFPVAAAVPAALLDAADRDLELRVGGDEDREVEDAVLLRPEDLLALVEEDGLAALVVDHQVVDGGAAGELGDRDLALAGSEGHVVEGGRGAEEGVDGERAGDVGLADLDRGGEVCGERVGVVERLDSCGSSRPGDPKADKRADHEPCSPSSCAASRPMISPRNVAELSREPWAS